MTIKEIAQKFSEHQFTEVYEHMSDDIVWENIGGETYTGKQAIVAVCDQALDYFAGIETTMHKLTARAGEDFVVVETNASYIDDNETSLVASCDIYAFKGDKLVGITSYNVELDRDGS